MNTYELAGSLLNRYIDELSAPTDDRALSTFELISLERERRQRPLLTISRERLESYSKLSMPAGRL